jgi:hypothetical protein
VIASPLPRDPRIFHRSGKPRHLSGHLHLSIHTAFLPPHFQIAAVAVAQRRHKYQRQARPGYYHTEPTQALFYTQQTSLLFRPELSTIFLGMPLFPNLPLLLFTEEDAELLLHYQAYVVATAHGDIQSHTHRSSLTLLFFSSSSSFASRPRATIQAWDKLQGSFVRSFVRSFLTKSGHQSLQL